MIISSTLSKILQSTTRIGGVLLVVSLVTPVLTGCAEEEELEIVQILVPRTTDEVPNDSNSVDPPPVDDPVVQPPVDPEVEEPGLNPIDYPRDDDFFDSAELAQILGDISDDPNEDPDPN